MTNGAFGAVPFDNQAAKGALIELLRGSRRAVLLVGSGTSIPVGYPSWPQLLDELRNSVVPELAQFPIDLDRLGRAELVRTALKAHRDRVDRQRQFDQYLSGRFAPRTPSHTQVHRTLVRLPVCGFVTTNYDPAIRRRPLTSKWVWTRLPMRTHRSGSDSSTSTFTIETPRLSRASQGLRCGLRWRGRIPGPSAIPIGFLSIRVSSRTALATPSLMRSST